MPLFETITYSAHAELRMRKRGISRMDVEFVLRMGEGYPDGEDDETWVFEAGHLRVVVVEFGATAHVVTVIRLRRNS